MSRKLTDTDAAFVCQTRSPKAGLSSIVVQTPNTSMLFRQQNQGMYEIRPFETVALKQRGAANAHIHSFLY